MLTEEPLLILPDNPLFELYTEATAQIGQRFLTEGALVQDSQTGLYRQANYREVLDYVYGGELDEIEKNFIDDQEYLEG